VISTLTVRERQQARAAGERERRTAWLYAMSREFASTRGLVNLLDVAARHISRTFDSRVAILMPDDAGRLVLRAGDASLLSLDANELGVAQWVFDHKEAAGFGTNTLPGAAALHLPVFAAHAILGVLSVLPSQPRRLLDPEQYHLLETFAGQTALAIERARLAEAAEHALIRSEMERVRSSLLADMPRPPRVAVSAPSLQPVPGALPDRSARGLQDDHVPTYLELLIADPALVPVVDDYPLQFVTMMNSSFADPQQLYQFRHPVTGAIVTYRADELRQAIGRSFSNAEFIPSNPADFVRQQRHGSDAEKPKRAG
jgi:hypothetical protein